MVQIKWDFAAAKGIFTGLLHHNTLSRFPCIKSLPSSQTMTACHLSNNPIYERLLNNDSLLSVVMTKRYVTTTNYCMKSCDGEGMDIGNSSNQRHAKEQGILLDERHSSGQEEDGYNRYWQWLEKAGCEYKGLQIGLRHYKDNTNDRNVVPLRGLFLGRQPGKDQHQSVGVSGNSSDGEDGNNGGSLMMFKEGAILASIPITACLSPITYDFLLRSHSKATKGDIAKRRGEGNDMQQDVGALTSKEVNNDPYYFLQYSVPSLASLLTLRVSVSYSTGEAEKYTMDTMDYVEACYIWLGCIISATRKQELNDEKRVRGSTLPVCELPYSPIIRMFPSTTADFVNGIEHNFNKLKTTQEKQDFMDIHRENCEIMAQVAAFCARQAKKEGKFPITVEMLEWGYRCAVSRAVMVPHNVSTDMEDVTTFLDGLKDAGDSVEGKESELESGTEGTINSSNSANIKGTYRMRSQKTSLSKRRHNTTPIVAPCIIPIVDMINHPSSKMFGGSDTANVSQSQHLSSFTPETGYTPTTRGNTCILTSMMGGYRQGKPRGQSSAREKHMKGQKEEHMKSKISENTYLCDVETGGDLLQLTSAVNVGDVTTTNKAAPTSIYDNLIILDDEDDDNMHYRAWPSSSSDVSYSQSPTNNNNNNSSRYSHSNNSPHFQFLPMLLSDEEIDILADQIEHCVIVLSVSSDIYPGDEIVMEYDMDDAPAALYRYGFLE